MSTAENASDGEVDQVDAPPSDEPAATETYSWKSAVAPDELVWKNTDDADTDDGAGSDVAAGDDEIEPVIDPDSRAG